MSKDPYYITTPIYYVNDNPHIGHAYTTLACDVLARFKALDGHPVLFQTGTDEHGQKVEKSAAAAGMEPQAFCDKVSKRFRELANSLGLMQHQFVRTTEENHKHACQDLWQRLEKAGLIYEDSYAGWYAVRDEAFYQESELMDGEGGQKLAPTGAPVEWVEEPSFFFRLSDMQETLLDFYKKNPDCIRPKSRYNEVVSFVEGGLKDLSISRTTFKWGVPVPGHKDHIMYVWIDALTNYISGIGYPDEGDSRWQTFWPAAVHMIGKDILRFHAVYWPAFLIGAGLEPPKRVFAHGWWTNEGQKISKSLGNVIDPFELIEEFGLDQVRYFLMREVPFGNDGDFSRAAFIQRMNGDLANDLGNLAQRCLSMIYKNCDAIVPAIGQSQDADMPIVQKIAALPDACRTHIDNEAIHLYLQEVWAVIRDLNSYFAGQEPWALKKTDPEKMTHVLRFTAECVARIAIFLQPIMPSSINAMLDQMNVNADLRASFDAAIKAESILKTGDTLPKPEGIFPRHQGGEGAS